MALGATPGREGGGGVGRGGKPTAKDMAVDLGKDVLACALDHYGLTAVGGSLAAAGANIIRTRGKTGGATPGTSVASITARAYFGDAAFKGGRSYPSLTGFPFKGHGVRVMWVTHKGTFVGRAVPVVGYAILAYDAFRITKCVVDR